MKKNYLYHNKEIIKFIESLIHEQDTSDKNSTDKNSTNEGTSDACDAERYNNIVNAVQNIVNRLSHKELTVGLNTKEISSLLSALQADIALSQL